MATATESTAVPRLIESTLEVFETMVFSTLVPGPVRADAQPPAASVMGAVRFLGSLSGAVSFYASDDAGCRIAAQLLGIEPQEAGEQMADAVGEITNMIAGTFRGRMAQAGETLMITTPTVTRGSDFRAHYFNVTSRTLVPFAMGDHQVFVELVLQAA